MTKKRALAARRFSKSTGVSETVGGALLQREAVPRVCSMFRRKDAILPTAGWSNDRRANGDAVSSGLSKSFIASVLWLLSSFLLLFGGYYYCKLNQQQTILECGADSCRIAMLTGGTLTEETLARDQLLRADYVRLNKAGEVVDTSAMRRKQLNELGATYGIVYRERAAPAADDSAKTDDAAADADVHALEEGTAGKPAGVPDAAHAAGERLKAKWASKDKRRRDSDQHDKPADEAAEDAQKQEPAAADAAAAVVDNDDKAAAAAAAAGDSKGDSAQQVNDLLAERLKNLEAVMAESKAAMEALMAQHKANTDKISKDDAAAAADVAADDNEEEAKGRRLTASEHSAEVGALDADTVKQSDADEEAVVAAQAAADSSNEQQQQQQQRRRLVSAAAADGLKDSLHAVAEQHAQGIGAVQDAAAAFKQLLLPNGAAAAVPLANGEKLLPLTRWDLGRRRATAGRKAVEAYILKFKGSEDSLLLEESVFWRLLGIWLMALGASSAVVAVIVGDFKPAAKPRKRHL
jgi:hypothetical protein